MMSGEAPSFTSLVDVPPLSRGSLAASESNAKRSEFRSMTSVWARYLLRRAREWERVLELTLCAPAKLRARKKRSKGKTLGPCEDYNMVLDAETGLT